ncbi:MAG TPA: RibD family protein [Anaerolineaceae bacterium]|nr:RibD family protein [Anaerolineaceae bacterium]
MLAIDEILAGAAEHHTRTGRPLVTLAYAQSLDGSIAWRRGQPTAISGAESARMTHQLRAGHDAILVGVGTVLADNPMLTVRLVPGANPCPVVLDPRLRIPLQANLLQDPARPLWIMATPGANGEKRCRLEELGAQVYELNSDPHGWIDLDDLLGCLGELGVERLMVEGGARVISSFIDQEKADRLVLTVAPIYLGGLKAYEKGNQVSQPGKRINVWGQEKLGEDLVIWGDFVKE